MGRYDLDGMDDILNQLSKDRDYIETVDSWVIERFNEIKQELIEEFEEHPVTREIDQGIGAENISETLSGITNLYSFIGFHDGDKPLEAVRSILHASSVTKVVGKRSLIKYTFNFPTAKKIFNATPMPWAIGRSWAQGIETGISGIGFYLKGFFERSQSGLGIQARNQVRPNIRFRNRKYISDMINRFTKRVIALEREAIK